MLYGPLPITGALLLWEVLDPLPWGNGECQTPVSSLAGVSWAGRQHQLCFASTGVCRYTCSVKASVPHPQPCLHFCPQHQGVPSRLCSVLSAVGNSLIRS